MAKSIGTLPIIGQLSEAGKGKKCWHSLSSPPCLASSVIAFMSTPSSPTPDTNRTLAHEVIAYAEGCACPDLRNKSLMDVHESWQSRYYDMDSQRLSSIAHLLSGGNQLPRNTVFLSLADRECVVALRILLATSDLTMRQVRAGLKNEHFPKLISAVRAFVSSSVRIRYPATRNWYTAALRILQQQKPSLMVVEGLQFGQLEMRGTVFSHSAILIRCAAVNRTGLALFD